MLNERGGVRLPGSPVARRGDQRNLLGLGLGHVARLDRLDFPLDRFLAFEVFRGGLELFTGALALERGDVADRFAIDYHRRKKQLVRAVPLLAHLAVDERVGEAGDVAAGFPDFRVHDDGGLEADDVVAAAHHVVPPAVADVFLQLGAERAVVEKAVEAAVDFGRGENEAAAFAERDDALHEVGG